MHISSRPLLWLIVACASSCGLARAQSAPEKKFDPIIIRSEPEVLPWQVGTSSSASKTEAALRDLPLTLNVVPLAVMRQQGMNSMQDVLKSLPAVSLASGDGQRDQVNLRGFSAIGDQFVDGLRDDALYFRDLSNIEQIDVIKGPAAVLYGRGSSGGLINRISKKPGVDLNEVSLLLGSWQQKRLEFDLGRKQPDYAMRLTGAVARGDSFRQQQFVQTEALAPSILFKLGQGASLLWQFDLLQDRRLTDFGIPAWHGRPVVVPASTYYGAANAAEVDFTQTRISSSSITWQQRLADGSQLRNALRYYHYQLNRNNTLVGSVDEVAQSASLNRSNVLRQEHGFFNQTEWQRQMVLGGMQHQLLFGLELGQQNKDQLFRTQNRVATVDLWRPELPVLPLTVNAAPSLDNLGRFKVAALYWQDSISIGPNWRAMLGLRFDRFEQSTSERRAGVPDLQRLDQTWSPRLGLVYQPDAATSWYASMSQSFQPSGESFSLASSNATIAPERTRNLELGFKRDWLDGDLSLNAALFDLQRNHIKTTDPLTNTVLPLGVQRTRGSEWSLSGQLGQGWQLRAGYAWLDARIIESLAIDAGQAVQGKRATLSSRHSGNLWLSKALAPNWRGGAGLNAVGSRFANPGNTVLLPGYVTLDAMLHWQQRQFEWQLNISNLLDKSYIIAGHGSSPNLNQPGAPRTLQLRINQRF